MARRGRSVRQGEFGFLRRGGKRPGAGRKPAGARAGVSHGTRGALASRFPVHVTVKLRRGLPSLRRKRAYRMLLRAFGAGAERFGFRLNHFSVQSNHVHLVVEARDRRALSRGMQGLAVRIARGLNRLWGRRGRVFADRYHDRILRTPSEVRRVLAYVLRNDRHHGIRLLPEDAPDPYSSGAWFDGWRERDPDPPPDAAHPPPITPARTWLQHTGWRRRGLLSLLAPPRPT